MATANASDNVRVAFSKERVASGKETSSERADKDYESKKKECFRHWEENVIGIAPNVVAIDSADEPGLHTFSNGNLLRVLDLNVTCYAQAPLDSFCEFPMFSEVMLHLSESSEKPLELVFLSNKSYPAFAKQLSEEDSCAPPEATIGAFYHSLFPPDIDEHVVDISLMLDDAAAYHLAIMREMDSAPGQFGGMKIVACASFVIEQHAGCWHRHIGVLDEESVTSEAYRKSAEDRPETIPFRRAGMASFLISFVQWLSHYAVGCHDMSLECSGDMSNVFAALFFWILPQMTRLCQGLG